MSEHAPKNDADRVVGKISYQFYSSGQQAWAAGEYETYVLPGETPDQAMMRAADNALIVAFEVRDKFVQSTQKKER